MGMLLGKLIGPYKVNKLLGKGGMGEVYLATDENLDRHVALKVLKPELLTDEIFISRFSQEAKTMAKFNHPHIATLYTIIKGEGQLIMAMEYIDGVPLDEYMKKPSGLSPLETLETIISVLEGLCHAHQKGIVHRDLKPSNIMFNKSGVVKVMDFGIARSQKDERHTKTGMIVGTLDYMAPELIKGEQASFASDLYAIGIIMYEALAGKLPFAANSEYTMMQAHVQTKPTSILNHNSSIPKAFSKYTLRLLEKDPAKRFSSTEVALQELKKLKENINPVSGSVQSDSSYLDGEKVKLEIFHFFKSYWQMILFACSILLLIGVGINRYSTNGKSTNHKITPQVVEPVDVEQFDHTLFTPSINVEPTEQNGNSEKILADLLNVGKGLEQKKKYLGSYPSLYLVAKQILEIDKNNATANRWTEKIVEFYFEKGEKAFKLSDNKELNQCIQVLENIAPNDNRLTKLKLNLEILEKRSGISKKAKVASNSKNESSSRKPNDSKKPNNSKEPCLLYTSDAADE